MNATQEGDFSCSIDVQEKKFCNEPYPLPTLCRRIGRSILNTVRKFFYVDDFIYWMKSACWTAILRILRIVSTAKVTQRLCFCTFLSSSPALIPQEAFLSSWVPDSAS